MRELWRFIRQRRNREVLGWLGGGLVVAAAGLWAAIVYFFPAHNSPEAKPGNVEAHCGGVAIGGNVTGTSITAGATINADCSPRAK